MTNKGATAERKLVNLLTDEGFAVMRAPASGGATSRALPDVLAGDGTSLYAIEAKRFTTKQTYVTADEIAALRSFAGNMGALPLVGGRPNIAPGDAAYGDDSLSGWFFMHPDELRETDGGNRAVEKRTLQANGDTLNDLVAHSTL